MTLPQKKVYSEQDSGQPQYFKVCEVCHARLPITYFKKRGIMRAAVCNGCWRIANDTRGDGKIILEPITSKVCAKCGIEKPIEDFAKYSTGRYGLHSYCKDCSRKVNRSYADKRLEDVKEQRRLEYLQMSVEDRPQPKICSNPDCQQAGIIQPPENFHKSRIHRTGLLPDCIVCELERKRQTLENRRNTINEQHRQGNGPERKAYHKRWRDENKEHLNKQMKDWREANPEHVKEKYIQRRFRQYGVTQEWYDKTLAAQGGMCAICGSTDPKSNGDTFHIDHNHNCCSNGCNSCGKCVRGLLCSVCNTWLGLIEKKDWVTKAKAYLRKFPLKDDSGNDQPSLFDGL